MRTARRVLIVEDGAVNRERAVTLVEDEGHEALSVASAREGLVLAVRKRPDLILMDIGLPGMSGYEAARRLKADPATSSIPILALTGIVTRSEEAEALRAGAMPISPSRSTPTPFGRRSGGSWARGQGLRRRRSSTDKTMRAVTYLRVSDRHQAEKNLSIPAQRQAIQAWAERNGAELVREFVDAGESARTDDRPAFLDMVAFYRQTPGIDCVLVYHIDRFSRSHLDHAVYKPLLREAGVCVVSITTPLDDLVWNRQRHGKGPVLKPADVCVRGTNAWPGILDRETVARVQEVLGMRAPAVEALRSPDRCGPRSPKSRTRHRKTATSTRFP